jgi:hypothetical protein
LALDDPIGRAGALVLIGVCVAASRAHAAPPTAGDADDLFGLPARKAAEPPLDCRAPGPFGCVFASDPLEPAPGALGFRLDAAWLADLPQTDATQDRLAALAPGVARDPFGVTVPGASGIENRWTIDGAPTDDPRTGGAGTRSP